MRQAEVYNNGVLAGTLTETDEGTYRFRYDDVFLADSRQRAIALSFPKSQQELRRRCSRFFITCLPKVRTRRISAAR